MREQSRGKSYRRLPLFRSSATDGAAIEDTAIEIDVTAANRWHQCCTTKSQTIECQYKGQLG
jgi:hypothetical protein